MLRTVNLQIARSSNSLTRTSLIGVRTLFRSLSYGRAVSVPRISPVRSFNPSKLKIIPSQNLKSLRGPLLLFSRSYVQIRTDPNKKTYLEQYATNLTSLAKEGKLDPIIGRDEEISRAIQILSRRTKNNPVVIGRAGVGKTSLVEGLAQRIVRDEVCLLYTSPSPRDA